MAHDYRGRLVYELLQNADDALAGIAANDDRVLFKLTDNELWVANTGRPFTEADVRGLCGLGASSKAVSTGPKRASIGHKGLGFKSVLEITDAPEAYSESVAFRLGKEDALEQVTKLWTSLDRGPVRDVPALRFPSTLVGHDATWLGLQSVGFRTAFRFPFHDRITKEQLAALAHQLLTLPMSSVLFLKHLEEVVIEVDTSMKEATRQWLLERHHVFEGEVEPCNGLDQTGLYRVDLVSKDGVGDRYWVAHNGDVPIGNHRDGLSGPAFEGVDVTEVSVAVRDADDPRVELPSRRFHVFLPTQEPSGCSLLVNGAFTTDLSRQHVQVDERADNYNGYLVRQAAETFVQQLLPHLLEHRGLRYVLRVLDPIGGEAGPAAILLSAALTDRLSSTPLIPANGKRLTLADAVLPSSLPGEAGADSAKALVTNTHTSGRRFPDPEFCDDEVTTVCVAYGAIALSAAESLQALARHSDPSKTTLLTGSDTRYRIDPVLDLCTHMWDQADADERQELEEIAPTERVFPVGENDDGTVRRIALGKESAFYPPGSSADELPLRRIRFLALLIDGEVIRVSGAIPKISRTSKGPAGGSNTMGEAAGGSQGAPRAAQGTDLSELDRLGMRVTFAFEQRRFLGRSTVVLPNDEPAPDADVLIVDVSSPSMIKQAIEQSAVVKAVFESLQSQGINDLYPGFDILTIDGADVDRMIELKSSGGDAQVQAMSWNEWKTARGSVRHRFWLYSVGNLRADLQDANPFVRAVQDPFGTLASSTSEDVIRKRTVQLRVRGFAAADELELSLRQTSEAGD